MRRERKKRKRVRNEQRKRKRKSKEAKVMEAKAILELYQWLEKEKWLLFLLL